MIATLHCISQSIQNTIIREKMHNVFNLEVLEDFSGSDFTDDIRRAKTSYSAEKKEIKKKLSNFIFNGTVYAKELEDEWFPQVDCDIFISHSHKDESLALLLAESLQDAFGLTCFIDSCVWGCANELIEEINDKYSDKEKTADGCIYNHEKCKTATTHVNVMLSIALQKMIDKAEVVFILNTPYSIKKYENIDKNITYSPWIYTETICTQIIRKRPLSQYREDHTHLGKSVGDSSASGFNVEYELPLKTLTRITIHTIIEWEELWKKDEKGHPLDVLYKIIKKQCILEDCVKDLFAK